MRAITLSLLVLTQACGVHYLAPLPLPPQATPAVSLVGRTPAAGETLVELEVMGEPARVDRIVGRQQYPQVTYSGRGRYSQSLVPTLQTVPLCQAPCVVSLPPGDHELLFTGLDPATLSTSSAFVRVGSEPAVVRHVMGYREDHTGRMVAAILLGSLAFSTGLTGTVFVAVNSQVKGDEAQLGNLGLTLAGVGLLAGAAAVLLGLNSETVVQPGATAVYPAH